MNALAALAAAALSAAPRAEGPSAFAPGEETVLQLRFLGMPSGEGKLTVGQPAGDVWPLIFQARTIGVAGFFDLREHLVTYWDSAARRSRGFDLRAYEIGEFKTERARFDRANGKASFVRVRNGKQTQNKVLDVPEDVQDLTGAVMWLRLQRLAPGDKYEVPVCDGTKQFKLVAEVVGRERVDTPAGVFDAVKVRARTQVDGKFSTKRDSLAWFSDDPRHIVLRMNADFAVGGLVVSLKSYRPGNRVAQAEVP